MKSAITIANFYYHNLFENLSLEIEENTFSVIAGPNNCGKTTLIRILNREIIIDDSITIMNRDIITYTIDIYSKLVGCLIPLEYLPKENNLEDELNNYNRNKKEIEWILQGLKIKRMLHKKVKDLSSKELILYNLAVILSKKPKIILIDTISSYFTQKEIKDIIIFLKEYQLKEKMTILYMARNLEEAILSDKLYIIGEKKIKLKGLPLEVLEKDNIINKIGLNLPFMIDLSVKLKDYEIINEICLEKKTLVDRLWK